MNQIEALMLVLSHEGFMKEIRDRFSYDDNSFKKIKEDIALTMEVHEGHIKTYYGVLIFESDAGGDRVIDYFVGV